MLGKAAISISALVAAPMAMAQAHTWRVMIQMGGADDPKLLLIDTSSLTSPTPDTRVLMVASYHAIGLTTPDGKPYNTVRITYRFDCKARTSQGIEVEEFQDEDKVAGGSPSEDVIPVQPHTLSGDLFGPACKGDFSRFEPITAPTPEAERDRHFGKR